jgi:molecular chaperone GrpE
MFGNYFDPWNAPRGWSDAHLYDAPPRRAPYARPAVPPAPVRPPAPVEPLPVRGAYPGSYARRPAPAPVDPYAHRSVPVDPYAQRVAQVDPFGRRPVQPDPFGQRPAPSGFVEQPESTPVEPVSPRAAPTPNPPPAARQAPPPSVEAPIEVATTDKAQLRRALEDLEASKRRVERDAERARDEARGAVIREMLPVLDNLDRSIAAGKDTSDPALLEGVKLVREQFEGALAHYGVTRVESVGTRFDPSYHEAIAMIEVEDPTLEGAVVDEWQRGYRLGDKLLRPAQVRVGRRREPAAET